MMQVLLDIYAKQIQTFYNKT